MFQLKPKVSLVLASRVSVRVPISAPSVSSVKVRVKVASAVPLFCTATLIVITVHSVTIGEPSTATEVISPSWITS